MKNISTFPQFILVLFAVGLTFTSCQKEEINDAAETAETELKEPPYKNYIVVSKSSELTKSVEDYLKTSDGTILETIPEIGMALVSSKNTDFVKNTLKNREIESVVPDYEIKWIPAEITAEANPPSIGNDETFFPYLWGMDAIDAPEAWNAGYTGDGATVYILDSGVSSSHPDIAPNLNVTLSRSFIKGEGWNATAGYSAHGTHVAGTVAAADNNRGVIGVAPNAELVAVKVLSGINGSGSFSAINQGIVYAATNGADVINMSLGATLSKSGHLIDADGNPYHIPAVYIQDIIRIQQRAVDYAFRKGSTIVASAGNDGVNYDGNKSNVKLPGGLNNVITVSATAPNGWNFNPYANYDIPSSYTTHGRSLLDVAAPGGDFDTFNPNGRVHHLDYILSTTPTGWAWMSGTSMAAPHVSGVAALIIAKNGGNMSPREVAEQIKKTANKVGGNGQSEFFGSGRVNAYRAVTE